MNYKILGERVRQYRKEMQLTQEELAVKIGMSASFLGHIERGTRILSVDTLVSLCHVLGCTPNDLLSAEIDVTAHDLPENLQAFWQEILQSTVDLMRKHLIKV